MDFNHLPIECLLRERKDSDAFNLASFPLVYQILSLTIYSLNEVQQIQSQQNENAQVYRMFKIEVDEVTRDAKFCKRNRNSG